MILEAFAEYLHEADPEMHSREVLAQWLLEKLTVKPKTSVEKVIHCEISLCQSDQEEPEECILSIPKDRAEFKSRLEAALEQYEQAPEPLEELNYFFRGTSESGNRLLKSLEEYSQSYENQKWARWVHQVKASDFNEGSS